MTDSDDRTDRVELRGMAPRRLVDLLDAVSLSRKCARQDVLVDVLNRWADDLVHEASMVMRIAGANGSSTDGERKGDGK